MHTFAITIPSHNICYYACQLGVFTTEDECRFKLYADSIYSTDRYIVAPPKGANVLPAQKNFNKRMSSLRISIEWTIGKIYWLCELLRMPDRHEMFRDDLGTRFLVGVVLTNCHTCLYGSQASMYFDCESPDLEDYLERLFADEVEV